VHAFCGVRGLKEWFGTAGFGCKYCGVGLGIGGLLCLNLNGLEVMGVNYLLVVFAGG